MVNKLNIASKNVNLEIVAKLMNSVARKYDCRVMYSRCENSLNFIGDTLYWRHIAEEMMEFFLPNTPMEQKPVVASGRELR